MVVEVVNHTSSQWMYIPAYGLYVPPNTRSFVHMPVEWQAPVGPPGEKS